MNPRIALPVYAVLGFSVAMGLVGLVFEPATTWPNVLLSGWFLAGLGLSGGFVVAMHDASGGRWLGGMRGIACSLTRLVLPGSLVVLFAVFVGGEALFPAFGAAHADGFRGWWLERTFFTGRAVAYVAAWLLMTRLLHRGRGAAAFLVVYGVTVSLATFDWIMALEAHWVSTILAVYHFAGMVTGAVAVIAAVAVHRSRSDTRITPDSLHDIGKLLFAFSTFWMYIWFSQAMLIWYGNIPEEAGYYAVRAYGNWGVLFWSVVAVHWVLPFLVLLPESAKRNRTILGRVAVAVLIAHWLDLYVGIVAASQTEPALTGWETALAFGTFAAVGWAVTRRESRAAGLVLEPARIR